MKTIIKNIKNVSFALISLMALSACGQKGPLVLEQVPVDATQAPLESAIDAIPVETPAQQQSDNDVESDNTSTES